MPKIEDAEYLCQVIWQRIATADAGKMESARQITLEMLQHGSMYCLTPWFDQPLHKEDNNKRMCLRCANGFHGLLNLLHDPPSSRHCERLYAMLYTLCNLPVDTVREMTTAAAVAQSWWVQKAWRRIGYPFHLEGETACYDSDPPRFVRCGQPKGD